MFFEPDQLLLLVSSPNAKMNRPLRKRFVYMDCNLRFIHCPLFKTSGDGDCADLIAQRHFAADKNHLGPYVRLTL